MFPPVERLTADGYDLQFGTNVLGKFSSFPLHTHHLPTPHRTLLLYQASPPDDDRHSQDDLRRQDPHRHHLFIRSPLWLPRL